MTNSAAVSKMTFIKRLVGRVLCLMQLTKTPKRRKQKHPVVSIHNKKKTGKIILGCSFMSIEITFEEAAWPSLVKAVREKRPQRDGIPHFLLSKEKKNINKIYFLKIQLFFFLLYHKLPVLMMQVQTSRRYKLEQRGKF